MKKLLFLLLCNSPVIYAMDASLLVLRIPAATTTEEQIATLTDKGQTDELMEIFLSYGDLPPVSLKPITGHEDTTPLRLRTMHTMQLDEIDSTASDKALKACNDCRKACKNAAELHHPLAQAFMQRNIVLFDPSTITTTVSLTVLEKYLAAEQYHRALSLLRDLIVELTDQFLAERRMKSTKQLEEQLKEFKETNTTIAKKSFIDMATRMHIQIYGKLQATANAFKNECIAFVELKTFNGIEWYNMLRASKTGIPDAIEEHGTMKVLTGLLSKYEAIVNTLIAGNLRRFGTVREKLFSDHKASIVRKEFEGTHLQQSINDYLRLYPGLPPITQYDKFYQILFRAAAQHESLKQELLEASFYFAKLYYRLIGDDATSDQLFEAYNMFLSATQEKAAEYFLSRATNALAYEASRVESNNTLHAAQMYSLKGDDIENPIVKDLYYRIALNLGEKALESEQPPETVLWIAAVYYKAACLCTELEDKPDLYAHAVSSMDERISLHEKSPDNALKRGQAASLLYKTAAGLNLCMATQQGDIEPSDAFKAFLLDDEGRVHFSKGSFADMSETDQFLFDREERTQAMTRALSHVHSMLEALGPDALPYHYEYALLITQHALSLYEPSEEYEAALQQRAEYLHQKMNHPNYAPSTQDYLEAFTIIDELIGSTSSQLRKGQLLGVALSYLNKSTSSDLPSYLRTLDMCLMLVKRHSEKDVPFPSSLRKTIYSQAVDISKEALEAFGEDLPQQTVQSWHASLMQALGDRALKCSSFKTTGTMAHMLCETALLCQDRTLISSLLHQGAKHIEQARTLYPEKVWPGPEITYLLSLIYQTLSQLQTKASYLQGDEEYKNQAEQFSQETDETDETLELIKKRYPELYLYVGRGIPEFLTTTLHRRNELEEFLGQVYHQQGCLEALEVTSKVYKYNRSDEFGAPTVAGIEAEVKATPFIESKKPSPFQPSIEKDDHTEPTTIERAFLLRDNPEAQARLRNKFLRYVTTIPINRRLFLRKRSTLILNTFGFSLALIKRALLLRDDPTAETVFRDTLSHQITTAPKIAQFFSSRGISLPLSDTSEIPLELMQELPNVVTNLRQEYCDELIVLLFLNNMKIWQEYHDDLMVLLLLGDPIACTIIDDTAKLFYTKLFYQESEDTEIVQTCDFLLKPFFTECSPKSKTVEELVNLFKADLRSTALNRLPFLLSGTNQKKLRELLKKHPSQRHATQIHAVALQECNDKIERQVLRLELGDLAEKEIVQRFDIAALHRERCSLIVQNHQLPTFSDYFETFDAFKTVANLDKDSQYDESKEHILAAAQQASEVLCEMIDMLGDEILGESQEQEALTRAHQGLSTRVESLPQEKGLKLREEIGSKLGANALLVTGHILMLKATYDTLKTELALQEKRLLLLLSDSAFQDLQEIDNQLTGTLQATLAIRLVKQRAELMLRPIPQEVTKIRNRLRVLCSEAVRIYDLYFMRCFGASDPQLEDLTAVADTFKKQENVLKKDLKKDLLNDKQASGYPLEGIFANNKVTQRCLLLAQSATYHTRAIDLLGESVSTRQLSDAVKNCLEGYQLAQDAQLPVMQARLACMTLTLLQRLLKQEQSTFPLVLTL